MEPNSILLYELRQGVRNRSVLVAIMLYLTAMTALTATTYIGDISVDALLDNGVFNVNIFYVDFNGTPNEQLVEALYLLFYGVTSLVLIGFGAVKIVFERMNGDLLYTTTLTPGRIVWGKFLLGIVISLLFGSMTLPFLTVAWLGRGIDIHGLFIVFLFVFALIQMHYASTLAMFAGAMTIGGVLARLLPWLIVQILLYFLAVLIFSTTFGSEPDVEMYGLLTAPVVLCSVAYLLATAQFAPETANRMFGVRVGLTILFAVFTTGMFVCFVLDGGALTGDGISEWFALLFVYPFFALWMLVPYLFLIFICERPECSNRQRQRIPKSWIGRLIVFPFYSGVANAMVWSTGMVMSGMLFLIAADYWTQGAISRAPHYDPFYGLHTFALLFFDYCATSLLFCRLVLRKRLSRRWYWVPVCVLIGAIVSVSFVSLWFDAFQIQLWKFFATYPLLPYPWPTNDADVAYRQYLFGEAWLAVLAVVGMPWIVLSFQKFKRTVIPPEPSTPCLP